MIEQNEIITIILGTITLLFIASKNEQIKRIPFASILKPSFYLLYAGWLISILEGFFWKNPFNTSEHFLYTLSAILFTGWCLKLSAR